MIEKISEEQHFDKSASSSSSSEEENKLEKKEKNKSEKKEEKKENEKNEEKKEKKPIEVKEEKEEENNINLSDNKEKSKELKDEKEVLKADKERKIEEIIRTKGFRCQMHFVDTEDGYTLTIYRIPGKKEGPNNDYKQPVLFQHGIFDSSDGWVCNGFHSLPFIFAEHNFDVWLANSRGNKYSKKHKKFDSESFEFWQFSFHDMGIYDIPAVINYINSINKSGEKIIYVGHSQGTSMMFSGLTQKFDFYRKNIKLFVALAPVARIANIGSTLLSILAKISIHKLVKKIKVYEMGANSKVTSNIISFFDNYATSLTNFFINLLTDKSSKEYNNQDALSVYLNHSPCGCSLKCLIHYVQIIKSKKFIYYDYKSEANFAMYHQKEPPEYDLNVIKDFPMMLIGGEMDNLGTPEDVLWLNDKLSYSNKIVYFKILPNMGHLSFMVAKDHSWFDEPFRIILENYSKKEKK